jgi:hypothetical protein
MAEVALAILDRDGVGGLTMRALAADLGVAPSTLYLHVRDKHELVSLVMSIVLPVGPAVTGDGTTTCGMRDLVSRIVDDVSAHPNVIALGESNMSTFIRWIKASASTALDADARASAQNDRLNDAFTVFLVGALFSLRGDDGLPDKRRVIEVFEGQFGRAATSSEIQPLADDPQRRSPRRSSTKGRWHLVAQPSAPGR